MLTNGTGSESHSIYLKLYVKNISNNLEYLVSRSRGDAIIFFYVDGNGKSVTLGHHGHPDQPWKDVIERFQRQRLIPPGKITSTDTEITTAETALLKTQTVKVQCKILLNNPTTKQDIAIVGSSQLITTTPYRHQNDSLEHERLVSKKSGPAS